jgi:hypothetical protein
MKRLSESAWFAAFMTWRRERRAVVDPADMGTAFGLDSITVVEFDASVASERASDATARDWRRRLARRSRL